MLLRIPVTEAIDRLGAARRRARRSHRSNVGEIARLLAPSFRLGRKLPGVPRVPLALLRIQRERGRNWHWSVWVDGKVYDPASESPREFRDGETERVFYYELEPKA